MYKHVSSSTNALSHDMLAGLFNALTNTEKQHRITSQQTRHGMAGEEEPTGKIERRRWRVKDGTRVLAGEGEE
uniref:Uncharacterized protein n=1 Tax=Arundo donax TaxID=35708 RepID=A0A0A8XSV5_ARUDO